MKRCFVIWIVLVFFMSNVSAQSDFGKKKLSRDQISKKEEQQKKAPGGPPDPGDGEGGAVPINGGLALLIGLSSAYFLVLHNRKRKEQQ